jgi:diguanylate cyclase (GGDEF)-like protein
MGLCPALLAARLAPSVWTLAAVAGSIGATASFIAVGRRGARELALLEARERKYQIAVSTAEARIASLEAKSRETASYDETTGVLNRRTFLTRLDEAIQRDARLSKPMAMLLIDIDGFKTINGEAGRLVGDRVLRTVGRALQASTRGTDFVGRVGGDEFAVLLGECLDPRPAVGRVFVALHGETTGGDKPLPIRVSIGTVTIEKPQLGVEPVALFRIAEDALASVQGKGGGLSGTREYAPHAARPVDTTSPKDVVRR